LDKLIVVCVMDCGTQGTGKRQTG